MKKLLTILLLGIFFISLTSAAEFDNYISDYNKTTETITFSNCAVDLYFGCAVDGADIGKVQLKTPRDFKVARGYNYVWELEAWLSEDNDDYNDFLKGFEFEDMNNGKEKVNRDIDIKILSYEDVEVDDYYTSCEDVYINNATFDGLYNQCERILNGSHIEQKEVWTKVTPADLKKANGKVTLRGYTDVQEGDYIDWSPLIFGVRVSHEIWATWTESLNVDLLSYYKLDDNAANTTVIDSLNNNTGTSSTDTDNLYNAAGKINSAFDFESSSSQYMSTPITLGTELPYSGGFTVSTWIKGESFGAGYAANIIGGVASIANSDAIYLRMGTSGIEFWMADSAISVQSAKYTFTPSTGTWYHVVATWDGTTDAGAMKLYVDNVERGNDTMTTTQIINRPGDLYIAKVEKSANYFDGLIDEFGVWTRGLSSSEVTQLWNGGDGITYTDVFGTTPSVILISPADGANFTLPNVDFVVNVTDEQKVDNVTLYIDGVLNETNSSGVNGTYTFTKSFSFGEHNWSILAYNNQSISNQSETRTFNYTDEAPSVTLTSPADNANLTSSSVSLQATVTDNIQVANVTLYIDGVLNETDTTNVNGSYSFSKTFNEGVHNWSILAYDNVGLYNQSDTWSFNYTQPPLFVNLTEPINNYNSSINTVNMSCLSYSTDGVTQLNLLVDDVINETIYNTTIAENLTLSKNVVYADGIYSWKCEAINDFSSVNSTIRTLNIDTTDPIVSILYPVATTYNINVSELNYSVVDSNGDKCWYSTDGGTTNSSAVSSAINFTNVISVEGTNTWTTYCNDTFGNEGIDSVTFERDTLYVTLNSPADNSSTAISSNVEFNCSANITSGDVLSNMSLWSNSSGSWAIDEIQTILNWSDRVAKITENIPEVYNGSVTTSYNIIYTYPTSMINYVTKITSQHRLYYSVNGGWQFYVKWNYKNGTSIDGTVQKLDFNTGDGQTWLTRTHTNPNPNEIVESYSIYGRTNSTADIVSVKEQNIYTRFNDITAIFNQTITGPTLWTCQACDYTGNCKFADSNFTLYIDTVLPTVVIESPTGSLGVSSVGQPVTLNVTFTDDNLESCWYNYNGTNITIDGCISGVKNSTTFILESDNVNLTAYANDSSGNTNSAFTNWSYTYFENNRTFNTQSYETSTESFNINIEGATSVTLFYNGTEYTTTKSGNNYNRTLQMPIGNLGNHSIYWRVDDTFNTVESYQNVSETVFTLCNATYSTKFLNISFKDEEDLSVINASIPTSTFEYWLGDGAVTKTYSFIDNTDNFNYEFCATPNRTLNFNSLIQYKQGSLYPQRVFSQDGGSLTNDTTDLILYLLGSGDGLFVTFQVLNIADQPISGVNVLATRILDGSSTQIAQGTTDAAGSVTFWMNPDFQHTINFTKSGLDTETLTIFPTQSAYTVSMGGGQVTEPDQTRGVSLVVKPQKTFLINNTLYNFNYTISSTYWNLEEFGFTLFYANGTEIGTETSTASAGGVLDLDANTLNSNYITMDYYYLINTTYTNATRIWYVQNSEGTEYSIWNFFQRFTTYTNAGLYGFDDFGKALISFLILVLVAGGLSFRYGINSEVAIMGIIFGLVLVLDVGLGLIPNPQLATQAGIENIVTVITGILLFGILVKEELR